MFLTQFIIQLYQSRLVMKVTVLSPNYSDEHSSYRQVYLVPIYFTTSLRIMPKLFEISSKPLKNVIQRTYGDLIHIGLKHDLTWVGRFVYTYCGTD